MSRLRIEIDLLRSMSTFSLDAADLGDFDGVVNFSTGGTATLHKVNDVAIPGIRLVSTHYFAFYCPEIERLDVTRDIDVEFDVGVFGATSSGDGTAQYEFYMSGYVAEVQRIGSLTSYEYGTMIAPQPIQTIANDGTPRSNVYKHRFASAPLRVHRLSMRIPANSIKSQSSACRLQFLGVFPSATYITGGMSGKVYVVDLALSGEEAEVPGWVTV